MDRLTMRWHGKSFCNASEEECEKNHDSERPDDCCCECEHQSAVYEKLYEYEDAEEQGLLLRLPCKVGDVLWTNRRMQGWYFRSKDAPYRVEVAFIGLNNSEEMGGGIINVCYENNGYMLQFNFSDIGKAIFLTKEEAEQALRERGSE